MTFRKYTEEEFKALLRAIDKHLETPAEIIMIGGAAALLAYKVSHLTADIDSYNNLNEIQSAYEEAKKETGLIIPLSRAGVADGPWNFEERLTTYEELKLQKLIVKIPEVHDLILMKTIRGQEHDLQVIEEICRKNKVEKTVLISRFESEMSHVISEPRTLELNFAAALSRCFGQAAGEEWISTR